MDPSTTDTTPQDGHDDVATPSPRDPIASTSGATTPPGSVAMVDRDAALELLVSQLRRAWSSFDQPRPAEPSLPDDLLERFTAPLPDDGSSGADAMADAARALDASVSPSRPLFVAYIGSTGLEAGVLAEALRAAYDVNMAASAGAVEHIATQAMRWMATFVGFPVADGVFTSGGMTSNLTALLAAREHALPGSRRDGVVPGSAAVYVSAEAHHSVIRAVEVCGLGSACIRTVEIDDHRRMRVDLLEDALARDRADGIVPVAVVATAGTTLTGAVDPLDAIADACGRHDVWLHVDGAYGAPAAGAPSRRALFAGLDRADSLTIDAHKWMGVQKSCSLVLVSRPGALEAAFRHAESYLPHDQDASHHVDRTLEYSRPVRSLKLWLALRTHGADQFRRWLDHTVALAEDLANRLRTSDDFELLVDPQLTTLCLRHVPAESADWTDRELDDHNALLARAVLADGRVYLAPAVLDGRVCIRLTLVNFRTTHHDLDLLLETIRDCAASL
ncbi:aminotransferase class V-fold PLP-dependent enzyme [Nitriliruptoria bacterium AS10]|nr:aminotransferase class V-fold PLP-dependent enzyme [Salsipaludibacter albus]